MIDDLGDTFGDGLLVGMDGDLRFFRRFIWRTDASKVRDLAGARFFIETFRIALFAHSNRCIDVNFDEITIIHERARQPAIVPVWRDERGDDQYAGIHQQLCYFTDAPDIFSTVFGAESEVGAQAVSDVVAVENVRVQAQRK